MRLRLPVIAAALAAAAFGAAPARATTVWAVGDGASTAVEDDQLAGYLQAQPMDKFLYLGDVYESGTAVEFATNYETSFGRLKAKTAPTPGNHEWDRHTEGYDPYWGPGVMQPDGGHYYSFDLAGWHFISLNSEEPSGSGTAQLAWLRSDLARYPGTCTIAFWHRPRFAAGPQYNTPATAYIWSALQGHAVAVVSGHTHNYERLFPVRGLTQFVVGTGGWEQSSPDGQDPRLAASAGLVVGALRLDIGLGGGSYQFLTDENERLDAGTLDCVPHTPTPGRVHVLRPKNRARYRSLRVIRGRAVNARRIRLRLVRRNGKRCAAYDGKRFRGAACSTGRSFPILGTVSWRASVPGLRPGAYRLTVLERALDKTLATRTVRFTIVKRRG
jgi:hypothetical protein